MGRVAQGRCATVQWRGWTRRLTDVAALRCERDRRSVRSSSLSAVRFYSCVVQYSLRSSSSFVVRCCTATSDQLQRATLRTRAHSHTAPLASVCSFVRPQSPQPHLRHVVLRQSAASHGAGKDDHRGSRHQCAAHCLPGCAGSRGAGQSTRRRWGCDWAAAAAPPSFARHGGWLQFAVVSHWRNSFCLLFRLDPLSP